VRAKYETFIFGVYLALYIISLQRFGKLSYVCICNLFSWVSYCFWYFLLAFSCF